MLEEVKYYRNTIKYKEEIKGSFYEHESLKAEQGVFRIEKNVRKDQKKKLALVERL